MPGPPMFLRVWFEEPWGWPKRRPEVVTSFKRFINITHPLPTLLAYRTFFALYWTGVVAYAITGPTVWTSGSMGPQAYRFMLYMTDWSALALLGYAWAALTAVLMPEVHLFDAAAWAFRDMAAPTAIMVAIMYWATDPWESSPITPMILQLHGANAVLVLVDMTIARYPHHLRHFHLPLALIASYLLFNFVWWSMTAEVIYGALDYGHAPFIAFLYVMGVFLVLFPFVHFALWRYELACFAWGMSAVYHRARTTSVGDDTKALGRQGSSIEEGPRPGSASLVKSSMFRSTDRPNGGRGGEEDEEVVIEMP